MFGLNNEFKVNQRNFQLRNKIFCKNATWIPSDMHELKAKNAKS